MIPLTFQFFGTWSDSVPVGIVAGTSISKGDLVQGSFEFERVGGVEDRSVQGSLLTSALGLRWTPFYFVENPDGWGQMAAVTEDLDCLTWLGPSQCLMVVSFAGPRDTGCGGNGTECHKISLFGSNLTEWSVSLAYSRDIKIDPYLPFAVEAEYFVPEPGAGWLLAVGLILTVILKKGASLWRS